MIIPIEIRFWSKVEKTDTCWNWKASLTKKGYGIFQSGYRGAHRFSYFLHFGEIPKGMLVCHKCDNPKCVRPDHLFIGTPNDNIQDMVNKNRTASGLKNGTHTKPERVKRGDGVGTSKLKEHDVIEIKKLLPTTTQTNISKIFNVSTKTIQRIKHFRQWKHIV